MPARRDIPWDPFRNIKAVRRGMMHHNQKAFEAGRRGDKIGEQLHRSIAGAAYDDKRRPVAKRRKWYL